MKVSSLTASSLLAFLGTEQAWGSFLPLQDADRQLTTTTTCEDLVCQNHGTCIQGQNYHTEGAVCDCTNTAQSVGGEYPQDVKHYIGRTCEIEVTKDDYCQEFPFMFCVNGGTCRTAENNFRDQPCECPAGKAGRFCEYNAADVRSDCTLTCNGRGRCEHGANPWADIGPNKVLNLHNGGTIHFMHCVCEQGWAGINCEVPYSQCDEGSRPYCFNGATCSGPGSDVCECNTDTSEETLAGEFCQFKVSNDCAVPVVIDADSALAVFDPENAMAKEEDPHCVHGVCYRVDDNNYYCDCAADAVGHWKGQRCDVPDVPLHDTSRPPTVSQVFSPSLANDEWHVISASPSYADQTPEPSASGIYEQCGDLECRNFGRCADGQNYEVDGALCDCSQSGFYQKGEFYKFVGPTCELLVQDNEYCPEAHGDDNLFCVNGGTCRNGSNDFREKPCRCLPGYTGVHCEYAFADVQESCSLTCSDHGTCHHGVKPKPADGPNFLLDLPNDGTSNFMYCNCENGFAGLNCEYEVMRCGQHEHYCFHGSECVFQDDGQQVCECSNTDGEKMMGDYCEFKVTDYCTDPIDIDEHTASKSFDTPSQMTMEEDPYCVNNGRCYRVLGFPGQFFYCSCMPGWTGTRCETKVQAVHETEPASASSNNNNNSSSSSDGLSSGGKFGIVVVVFVVIGAMAVGGMYFQRRARMLKSATHQENQKDGVFRDSHLDSAPFEDPSDDVMPTENSGEDSGSDNLNESSESSDSISGSETEAASPENSMIPESDYPEEPKESTKEVV